MTDKRVYHNEVVYHNERRQETLSSIYIKSCIYSMITVSMIFIDIYLSIYKKNE